MDLGILISQSLRVEQLQSSMAQQQAAQQQAAQMSVEQLRAELARQAEPAQARPGRSGVYNDERRDNPPPRRRPSLGKDRPEGSAPEDEDSSVDRLA